MYTLYSTVTKLFNTLSRVRTSRSYDTINTWFHDNTINWLGFHFASADPFVLAQRTAMETSLMALAVTPTGHSAHTLEQQRASLVDVWQIPPIFHPLVGSGIPFPAPVTGIWDLWCSREGLYSFQTNLVVWRACLVCLKRAFWVGGMESRDLRPRVNISFLASFTDWAAYFLLCLSTVRCSIRLILG